MAGFRILILGTSSEERQRHGRLGMLLAEYRGCDGFDDAVTNVRLLAELSDLPAVLIGQSEIGATVLLLDAVRLYFGRKYWEASLVISMPRWGKQFIIS